MERNTKASGLTTRCMVMVTLYGQMEKSTLENSLKISAMATENSSGRTVASIMASGSKESSTVLASIEMLKARIEEASGKMEKELAG